MRLEDLDFGKLKAFQIVADEGSLRAAALKMRLTSSAISAKLGRLEEILGVRLFQRGPKSLKLTTAGQRLRAELSSILDETEKALGRVASNARRGRQHLDRGRRRLRLVFRAAAEPVLDALSQRRGQHAGVSLLAGARRPAARRHRFLHGLLRPHSARRRSQPRRAHALLAHLSGRQRRRACASRTSCATG